MNLLNKYMLLSAGLLTVFLAGTGCKQQLNINTNPNYPTSAQGTQQVVFPIGVLATTGFVGGTLAIIGGMWSQYYTQSAYANQYTDIDSYNMQNSDPLVDAVWDNLYANGLENYEYVIQKADSTQDWTYFLMGTVMKAYTAQVMVDLWDQIPYSQALGGLSNLNPKFDSGYAVYTGLIAELEAAKAKDFTANTNSSPTAEQDPVFGGSVSQWIAFANTLELKMYLRMSRAQPSVAQAGIQALYNSGAKFLTTDASFTNFTDNPGLENPMYDQNIREQNTNSNLRASTTFVSWLTANSDWRILYFFNDSAPASVNQGDYHGNDPNYANAPIFVETPKDPVEFISLAEIYFLEAEADVRYFGGTKAQALYNAGVTESFNECGQDASSYIATGGVYAWGNEQEGGTTLTSLQQIARQKWVACCYGCHGIEAFFEQTRTGVPAQSPVYSTSPSYIPGQMVVAKNSVLPAGTLPRRLFYAYDEVSRNSNAPAEVPMGTPVWWGR
jgi:hypothetical protein